MFIIKCPYCGNRDQSEFVNGGEAHIERPQWDDTMSDAEWANFVFLRKNEKGVMAERWNHAAGCGKWFNALRNNATDKFLAFYEIGTKPPKVTNETLPTPSGEMTGSGNDAVKLLKTEDEGRAQ